MAENTTNTTTNKKTNYSGEIFQQLLNRLDELNYTLGKSGPYLSSLTEAINRHKKETDKLIEAEQKQYKDQLKYVKIKDAANVENAKKYAAELLNSLNASKFKGKIDTAELEKISIGKDFKDNDQFLKSYTKNIYSIFNQIDKYISDEKLEIEDERAKYLKRAVEIAVNNDTIMRTLNNNIKQSYEAVKEKLDISNKIYNSAKLELDSLTELYKNHEDNAEIKSKYDKADEDFKKAKKDRLEALKKEAELRDTLYRAEMKEASSKDKLKKLQDSELEYFENKQKIEREYNRLTFELNSGTGEYTVEKLREKYGIKKDANGDWINSSGEKVKNLEELDEKNKRAESQNLTNMKTNSLNENARTHFGHGRYNDAGDEYIDDSRDKRGKLGTQIEILGKGSWVSELVNKRLNKKLDQLYTKKEDATEEEINDFKIEAAKKQKKADIAGGLGEMVYAAAGDSKGALSGTISKIVSAISAVKNIFKMLKTSSLGLVISILKKIYDLIDAGFKKAIEAMEKYAELQTTYYAKINTRLMGTGLTFDKLAGTFSDVFGTNPYISQQTLLEKMSALVESGVVYNLEQRSILATLSDRMVSTFSMLDQTLTGLTKLYQTDLSVSALGIEGLITNFLNKTFEDNSYMSEVYDTVASNLYEAMSQFTEVEESSEFMYSVQKWLGSLYSVGMSSEGVNLLAQGINMLATGDVEGFNGNDSLRNLFALATNGSYADYLVNGFRTADEVNELLYTIIEYLANISEDSNQVTKKVNAGIFGNFKLSDIKSIQNLTGENSELLTKIYNENQGNWNNTVGYVSNVLLSNVADNTSEAQLWNNVADNFMFTLGESIMNSQVGIGSHKINAYSAYKVGKMLGLDDIATAAIGITNLGKIIDAVKDAGGSILDIFQGDTSQLLNSYNNAYAIDTESGIIDNGVLMKKVVNDYTKKKLSALTYNYNKRNAIGIDFDTGDTLEFSNYTAERQATDGVSVVYDRTTNKYTVNRYGISDTIDGMVGLNSKSEQDIKDILSPITGVERQNISIVSSSADSIVNSVDSATKKSTEEKIDTSSSSYNSNNNNVSSTTATNSADITSSTKYNNDYDTEVQKTLTENAKTVATSSAVYSEENQSIIRSVNDIYAALFEDKLIIRVALAEVETKAQSSLAISNGAVNVYSTGGKLASVDSVNSLTKINNTVTVTSVR